MDTQHHTHSALWRACAAAVGIAPRALSTRTYLDWLHARRRAYVAAYPDRVTGGVPKDEDHWVAFVTGTDQERAA